VSIPLYLSIEKISLENALGHIEKMTNDNSDYYNYDLKSLNIQKFTNNIKNGFIVLTMLISFLEGFLNSIILYCIHQDDPCILSKKIVEKVDYIYSVYKKDKAQIKGGRLWQIHIEASKVRNALIHYKYSKVGEGVFVPDFEIGGQYVAEYFTQKNMIQLYDHYQELSELIAETISLKLNPAVHCVESQGRDNLNSYIYDDSKIIIDSSRF